MTVTHLNTPLFSLDIVAFDTEATDLDPRRARIVEIGAVDVLGSSDGFSSFVNPGIAIPAGSTGVHGIDDAMVADAPGFAAAFGAFLAFVGDRPVVAHSIGYDLALFEHEAARSGLPPWTPHALDTRTLAQLVLPRLPAFTLEILAEKLGVELGGRHRARGDAESCARIFRALVPLLRDAGIRTLAEAIEAMRRREDGPTGVVASVWTTPNQRGGAPEIDLALRHLDPFLFSRRIGEVMRQGASFADPSETLAAAVERMAADRIGSVFVGRDGDAPESLGIVTERDIMKALARHGPAVLDRPLDAFASRPLETVFADAFLYSAVGRMNRLSIRHLGVVDSHGRMTGAVSMRDLMRSRLGGPVALGDGIEAAQDVQALGRAWAPLPPVVGALLDGGLDGRTVGAIVGREVGALTRRAAELAVEKLAREGHGPPPCAFAVVVFGSAGRGESLLAFDQDNGIVFAEGEPGGPEDRWFEAMGREMCATLHLVGVPKCRGGVMASEPAYRGSLATWRERARTWVGRSRPEDLLSVDIVFDMRPVHGDFAMADALWRDMNAVAHGSIAFLKLLADAGAEGAGSVVGMFGRIRTDAGLVDLKMHALKPVVTFARVVAIRQGLDRRGTGERLQGLIDAGTGGLEDLQALDRLHGLAMTLIARHQTEAIAAGLRPDNSVSIAALDKADREALVEGLRRTRIIPDLVRDRLVA